MVGLQHDFEELAGRGCCVRLAGPEDRDVSARQPAVFSGGAQIERTERNHDAVAASG